MPKFANGKNAFAISDRSGMRYRYQDMRREWNGSLVGKDEFEAKHPQLKPFPKIFDPEALQDARPDRKEPTEVPVGAGGFPDRGIATRGLAVVGTVTIGGDAAPASPTTADTTGVLATVSLGSISIVTEGAVTVAVTGASGTASVGTVTATGSVTATYTITVQSYYGANKYYVDGSRQATVTLSEGSTYRFDQSDSSNSGHPLRFSTTSDGTHGGGSEYTTGVTTNGTPGSSGAYTQITVASGAPTLYYYCTNHSGMGGQANTP